MDLLALPLNVEERLREASHVVAFSGAGLSAESGLGTFRGADGLWTQFRPEELASPEGFSRHPSRVWDWYLSRYRAIAAADPNPGHRAIASWAPRFPSLTIVTQNIDGLHQRAGSDDVLELHGSLLRARCSRCDRPLPMAEVVGWPGSPPACDDCGGKLRPDVVWFGEILPEEVLAAAIAGTEESDVFVAVGTSATVYPAAGLIELAYRQRALVIEINPEETTLSSLAGLCLRGPAGQELPRLTEAIERCRSAPR